MDLQQQHPTTALVSRLPTTLCQGKFEDDNANILQCDGLLWRMRQEEGWECSVREGKERLSWVAIEISMQAHTRKAMDYAQRDQSLNILSWEIARFRAGGSCSEKEAIQHNTAAAVSIMSVLPCTSRNSVSCRFSLGTRHQILYFLTAYNSLLSHKRRKNRMNSALESAHTGNICTQNPKANQPHCSTHCHHNGLELQHDNSMSFFGLQYVNFQTAFFDAFPVEHVLACVADSLLPLLRFSNKNSVTFEIRYWARKLLLIPEILWAKRINDIIIDRELRIKELNWFSTVGGGLSQLAQVCSFQLTHGVLNLCNIFYVCRQVLFFF